MLKTLKLILLFLILPLILSTVAAENFPSDFEIEITPITSTIFEDEVAMYNLTISNKAYFEESFMTPYTSDTDWLVTTDPELTRIPANTTRSYILYLDPKTDVLPGQHGSTINVRSTLSEFTKRAMTLTFIKPLNPLPMGYTSSIALKVEVPTKIDPRKEIPVQIYLRNRNAKEYPNLTISIESRLLNKNYSMPFMAVEEKTEEYSFSLDPYTLPQEDKLIVTIYNEGNAINQVKVPLRIVPYTEVREDKSMDEKFLKTETIILLTNFGNIDNNETFYYETGPLKRLVTFTTPESEYVKKDDKRYLSFPVALGPGDTLKIEIATSYRFLFYSIFTLVIAALLYFQLRSPVIVKKDALANEPSHDGVSEFKVKVLIKNRSQKPVENVKIIETIPSLAVLIREATVGTIEPTKVIRNDKHGTMIRWDINYLEPFEERIITYRIKSQLNIVGGLTLNESKVKFETISGRERVTYSKKHRIKIYA